MISEVTTHTIKGHPFSTYAVRGGGGGENFAYFPMYAHIKIAYRGQKWLKCCVRTIWMPPNISKGESTVDLAIVSDTLFDYIDDFKVHPQKDFSDHCKIILTIKNVIAKETPQTDNYKWVSKEPEFKWNNNPVNFVTALESPESMAAINQCNQLLEAGLIEPSYDAIHKIFISAAEKNARKIEQGSHSFSQLELQDISRISRTFLTIFPGQFGRGIEFFA